jgi:endonuclease/exonuclease/phosphatase family metal-dependent hydrolase
MARTETPPAVPDSGRDNGEDVTEATHWDRLHGRPGPDEDAERETDLRIEVAHQGPAGFVYLQGEHDQDFTRQLAEALVRDAHLPLVVVRGDEDHPAYAYFEPRPGAREGVFRGVQRAALPLEADAVFGEHHPYVWEVAQDIVRVMQSPGAGQIMISGWRPEDPLSLQNEVGAHGGPGPHETSAFVLLPPEAQTLVRIPDWLRPRDLRRLALEVLGRSGPEELEYVESASLPTPKETDEGTVVPLRLMTYNVHGCRGMDGKFAPERIARVIARERPDVVCLQELDQERSRSGGIDQVDIIAKRLQTEYHFHAVMEVDDGRFGNAVLSLLPVHLRESGPLPSAPRAKQMFSLEDRGALWVTVEVDGHEIHVVNTHLSLLERERRLQVEALLDGRWLGNDACEGAVVLAGDFNAAPQSWTLRRLSEHLRPVSALHPHPRRLHTWSGRLPLRQIDHVLVSDTVRVANTHVPRTRLSRVASDHLPLVVDLECLFRREAERLETAAALD